MASPVNIKDVEMGIVILQENPGIFGDTITKLFIEHLTHLVEYNKEHAEKDEVYGDYFIMQDINCDVWHMVTNTAIYKLYQNLDALKRQVANEIYNG